MFNVPLPSLLRMSCYFRWKCEIPFDPNTPPKKCKTPNIRPGKKKRIRRLGRGTLNTRVQNFRVHLSKTAWALESEGIWGFMLEPGCTRQVLRCYQCYEAFTNSFIPSNLARSHNTAKKRTKTSQWKKTKVQNHTWYLVPGTYVNRSTYQ